MKKNILKTSAFFAILPSLLIIIGVVTGFFLLWWAEIQGSFMKTGQERANNIAETTRSDMEKQDLTSLQARATFFSQMDDISDIVFLSADFIPLTRSKQTLMLPAEIKNYPVFQDGSGYFAAPIEIDVNTEPSTESESQAYTKETKTLGWIIVVVSQSQLNIQRNKMIAGSIFLIFIAALLLFIVRRYSRQFHHSSDKIIEVLDKLQQGSFNIRVNENTDGISADMEQSINRLAKKLLEMSQNQQQAQIPTELQAMLEQLEKRNKALSQASKNADDANQAKDEFLARMSHELRTPLTSVSGFANLMMYTELNREQQEYMRIINQASVLLLSIIDDVLDYSKLESNALSLESIPFELESCIFDVLEMQGATADKKGLELFPIITSGTPKHLVGDPVRLRQVLSNLISNAVKFTERGQILIRVSTERINAAKVRLNFSIEDTGAGIAPSQINFLFKAFNQADTSITRRYGGSGLGLVIAKRLTELMAGEIWLESKKNQGTKIYLQIPFFTETYAEEKPDLRSNTIIIYDENPEIRESLRHQLTTFNPNLIETDSNKSLMRAVEKMPRSTVIWGLPANTNSTEQMHAIKLLLKLHKGTIILLSNQPQPLFVFQHVIQLRKPIRTLTLLEAIKPDYFSKQDSQNKVGLNLDTAPSVLIAEDNDFNRLLIRKILEKAKARVIEADTGEAAVKQAKANQPDIILMDVHMPVMDGIEATARIRQFNPEIPIVALTANVVTSEHIKLVSAGVNHVLLKPVDSDELCRVIDQLLLWEKSAIAGSGISGNKIELEPIVEQDKLHDELCNQLKGLINGLRNKDLTLMRHHSHQLMGLAGLYQMPQLEVASNNLHDALKAKEWKTIWQALWQLQRIIESKEYEEAD